MSDDWDDDSGVQEQPLPPGRRALSSVTSAPEPRSSAKAAFREIRALKTLIDDHSRADKLALDTINVTLTGMRVEQAGTRTALEIMNSDRAHARAREIAEVENTGQVVKLRTTGRYRALMAAIGLAGTALGILSAYLAGKA